MQENALDFVRYVLSQICKEQDQVSVEMKTDDQGTVIFIRIADADMGKLIGKGGQNIAALRTLVRVIGARDEQKVSIKVLEPGDPA